MTRTSILDGVVYDPKGNSEADYLISQDSAQNIILKDANGSVIRSYNLEANVILNQALGYGGHIVVKKHTNPYMFYETALANVDNTKLEVKEGATLKIADSRLGATRKHLLKLEANDLELCGQGLLDGNMAGQTDTPYCSLVQLGSENATFNNSNAAYTRFNNIKVHDMRMINSLGGHIRAFKLRNVQIYRNYLSGVPASLTNVAFNMHLGWIWNVRVLNNFCDLVNPRSSSNNIIAQHTGNSDSGCEKVEIAGNEVHNSSDSPIEATSSTSGSALVAIVKNVSIHHNFCLDGAGIISLGARDVNIHDNWILGPWIAGGNLWGIRIGGHGTSDTTIQCLRYRIARNHVLADASQAVVGISCQSYGAIMQHIKIIENELLGQSVASSIGIQINGSSVADPNHTTEFDIALNTIRNWATKVNKTGLVATAKIREHDNRGYITENQGYSTGTGAQQTIAHGLDYTPDYDDIVLSERITGGALARKSAIPDATNIYVLATSAKDYTWKIRKEIG